ncbi:PAS domain-containing protein [Streptomyces montanisoli]|uniref:PAS domain-containing protein n=1 Tax=Streptomyces montanisoli TaxID=2798581 RepID=A0A940MGD4_9ACTN|nr:PAS domain-containing protein [Streptomyces montanisoli]MBP0458133.1 PAS domain-containing protein [Streptomyces montanisoli]
MDSGFPPALPHRIAAAGRIPLGVAVVDRHGLVSHWSTGARQLFGHSAREAVGRYGGDLMPVSGGLAPGHRPAAAHPAAGRATVHAPDGARTDILWWTYPLGAARGHLVLAADGRGLTRGGSPVTPSGPRVMPGFARHTRFPDGRGLAERLPGIMPAMSRSDAARITARVLELGYPVLEFTHHQVPLTPVRQVPRQAGHVGRACAANAASL